MELERQPAMLERVAKAIQRRGESSGDIYEMARAAIEEMRLPTEAMQADGSAVGYMLSWADAAEVYTAMIDVALGKTREPFGEDVQQP